MLQAMSDTMGWKRAKGKKKGKAVQPDLSRIYGYINDADENDADLAGNTIQVSRSLTSTSASATQDCLSDCNA